MLLRIDVCVTVSFFFFERFIVSLFTWVCVRLCAHIITDCSHQGTGLCECCASQLVFVLWPKSCTFFFFFPHHIWKHFLRSLFTRPLLVMLCMFKHYILSQGVFVFFLSTGLGKLLQNRSYLTNHFTVNQATIILHLDGTVLKWMTFFLVSASLSRALSHSFSFIVLLSEAPGVGWKGGPSRGSFWGGGRSAELWRQASRGGGGLRRWQRKQPWGHGQAGRV